MATITLPKISELDDNNPAFGTDVLANDQEITNFLNGSNIDQNNVNLAMTPIWTSAHRFVAGLGIDTNTNLSLNQDLGGDDYITSNNGEIKFFQDGGEVFFLDFNANRAGSSTGMDLFSSANILLKSTGRIILDSDIGSGAYIRSVGTQIRFFHEDTEIFSYSNINSGFTLATNVEVRTDDIDPPSPNAANRNSFVRGWGNIEVTGASSVTINSTYNVSSVTVSSFQPTINWDTDFIDTNYAITANAESIGGPLDRFITPSSKATGSAVLLIFDVSAGTTTTSPTKLSFTAIGDQ